MQRLQSNASVVMGTSHGMPLSTSRCRSLPPVVVLTAATPPPQVVACMAEEAQSNAAKQQRHWRAWYDDQVGHLHNQVLSGQGS